MRIKTINCEMNNGELLNQFIKRTEQFLNISYPIEYLKRSLVRGLFRGDELVGGYIICLTGPLRVIESLPEIDKAAFDQRFLSSQNSICEFTGLWLDRSVKSNFANFMFWTQIYLDIITSKKEYMVYAYGLDKKKLGDLYSIINPEVIFRGATKIMDGMKYAEEESIELASVQYLKFALFHRGDFLLKKLFIPRALCNKRVNAFIPGMFKYTKKLLARA